MSNSSFIGQLQLHQHGALDSVDHWHCRVVPLGCFSATVVSNRARRLKDIDCFCPRTPGNAPPPKQKKTRMNYITEPQ